MAQGGDNCGPVKMIRRVFSLDTLEKLMKDCPGGSYLIINSTPSVTGVRPLLDIGYKCNSRKVLGFIDTEGAGIIEPGDPYLSHLPDIYSNVSVCPVVRPHLIGRCSNACNAIESCNMMCQYDLAIGKYWVTQSGHFRLVTTVSLGVGVTYWNLIFCHGIPEESVEKKI